MPLIRWYRAFCQQPTLTITLGSLSPSPIKVQFPHLSLELSPSVRRIVASSGVHCSLTKVVCFYDGGCSC
eukprot:c37992_g1_i1 orf=169-378(-)